jgi:23S rRNA pseudouridine1911/1915/1917 synthase
MSNISERILYEDNHIIIVNKNNNEIVQGDISGDTPITETVKQFLKEKYNKPGEAFLGLPHRLDRPVSGIVILAKTSKVLTRLTQMFKDREIKKIYWAIVKDKPEQDEAELVNYLLKNTKQNKSYTQNDDSKGAKLANLNYKVIDKSDNFYLLEIELGTGRHHQIRAQLSDIGCPIKGDVKYGFRRPNFNKGISLHARRVEFVHPVSKELINITAPCGEENTWKYFVNVK